MRLEIELRCILFTLIILEMFLQLDWSPPVLNSIDRTWFGKSHNCLYKVPQLIVQSQSKNQSMRSIAQFGQEPALGRVLVVPKFFHLRLTEVTVFLETFIAAAIFRYPSPDLCLDTILSRSSQPTPFDLMAWFLLWHVLSTVGPYTGLCLSKSIGIYHRWTPIKWWSMETGGTGAQFRVS